MNLFAEFKTVSDNAIDQLAGRFKDLPRPLLAAIGAGDLAVEQLAKLREQVSERFGSGSGMPSGDDVKSFASEFPDRAQKIAGDVAHQVEEFAQAAPEKVQRLIGELPAKASELGEQLSPENLRSTLDAYTETVGNIYGTLADRGGQTVAKAREHGDGGAEETAADTGATKPRSAKTGTTRTGSARTGSARTSAAKSGTGKSGTTTSRTGRSTTSRTRASRSTTSSSSSGKASTGKSSAAKSGTAKSSTGKSSAAKSGTGTRRTSTRSTKTGPGSSSAEPTDS